MRLVPCFAVLGLAASSLAAPMVAQAAEWNLLKFHADGFGIESPVALTKGKGVYKAAVAGTIPTIVYSGDADNVHYQVTIIDISKRVPEFLVHLFEEAEYLLCLTGDVVANEALGVEPGALRNYGREIAINQKDGTSTITSIMYSNGKIYEAEAIVPKDGDKSAPEPQRFVDSIIFALDGPLRDRDLLR